MVESLTKNYKWTKPEVTKSPTTWGGFLNDTTDSIDGILFAAQNAGAPVGATMMFVGATAPANWLLCNGTVYLNTDIPLLAPILNNQFNAGTSAVAGTSSAVPNLNQRFPMGAGPNPLGQSGGAFAITLTIPNLPAHSHTVSITGDSHYHTIPAWTHTHTAYQDGHTHYVNQDPHAHTVGNTAGHNHVITTGNHAHNVATGGHTHTVYGSNHAHSGNLLRFVGSGGAVGVVGSPFNATYGNTDSNTTGNMGTSDPGNLGGNTDTAGNLGGGTDWNAGLAVGNTDSRTPAVHADTQYPAIHVSTDVANIPNTNYGASNITATAVAVGSGTAFSVVPPFVALNFIVRYK